MVLKVFEMKKIFAALLAVLFITGAVFGCGKTPQTELNQDKQQAAEQNGMFNFCHGRKCVPVMDVFRQ